MQAAVIKEPGKIVVEEVPTPAPGPGEVLLKVDRCALCGTDQRVLAGTKNVDVPIVGHEIAGVVEAVGDGVAGIKQGQRYAVQTVIGCGKCPMCEIDRQNLCEEGFKAIGYQWNGGFAQYMVMPKIGVDQGCLIPLDDAMSSEVGTLIEPLSCCVNGMRYIPLEECEEVVIMGGGIIGVLNGLVAHARGAGSITIMDVSSDRLALLDRMGLPFTNYVNSADLDPIEWVRDHTSGRGVDAVVVAASVKSLVSLGLQLLARAGHLSIFAGMPKDAPTEPLDLNLIHYRELTVSGANSSVQRDYLEARDFLAEGKIDGDLLVTHRFSLSDFNQAVETQKDLSAGSLKILIDPWG